MESLDLPAGMSASANPKSSTGRLDIFTRVITDRAQEFDKIPAGYTGPLTIEREIAHDRDRQKADIGKAVNLLTSLKKKILG